MRLSASLRWRWIIGSVTALLLIPILQFRHASLWTKAATSSFFRVVSKSWIEDDTETITSIRVLQRHPSDCENQYNVSVFPIPNVADPRKASEAYHFILDGIDRSRCLFKSDNQSSSVWVVSAIHSSPGAVMALLRARLSQTKPLYESAPLDLNLTIHHVDWSDSSDMTLDQGFSYERILANYTTENITGFAVHRYKRSLVEQRNTNRAWNLGRLTTYPQEMHHIPYGVRSDFIVEANAQILLLMNTSADAFYNNTMPAVNDAAPINPALVEHARQSGVRSFWSSNLGACGAECRKRGRLRVRVSKAVEDFGDAVLASNDTADEQLRTSLVPVAKVEMVGTNGNQGRGRPSKEYMHDLLAYKIIVVAQRDHWEGHYRLMEAFMGGALVFHDKMLTPPRHLVHAEHYVIYDSLEHLVEQIRYYLTHEEERRKIAHAGWKLVMEHYRSWHLMETMVFRDDHLAAR